MPGDDPAVIGSGPTVPDPTTLADVSDKPKRQTAPDKPKRGPRKKRPIERVCVSIDEWIAATGFSRPTVYRMMADGRLRYVSFGNRMRKIPVSEFARLGLA